MLFLHLRLPWGPLWTCPTVLAGLGEVVTIWHSSPASLAWDLGPGKRLAVQATHVQGLPPGGRW